MSSRREKAKNPRTKHTADAGGDPAAQVATHHGRASRLPPQGAQSASASTIRELARAVGRSHSAVQDWVRHPEWDQPAQPPWNVAKAAAWAARTLAPNPADAWRDPGPSNAVNGDGGGLDALRRNPLSRERRDAATDRGAQFAPGHKDNRRSYEGAM